MFRSKTTIYALMLLVFLASVTALSWAVVSKERPRKDPWDGVPPKVDPTSHARLFEGKTFEDGPSVTKACLECHPEAAHDVMKTSHWLWLGEPEVVPGHSKPVRIGKRNTINNFCISIESNWPKCTVCHAGYGWEDESFDFKKQTNVDCLICHDRSGTYSKGLAGRPDKDVDLLAAARSVGRASRDNCGWCHFNGGGGNAVKHGDLDGSLAKPVERIDVHMGRHGFACTACHRTEDHQISGKMMSVTANDSNQIACTNCHDERPHNVERLNEHIATVACQTCHVPFVAKSQPTKVAWDWSTAGKDIPVDDPHRYLKIKGSFLYAKNLVPEYAWFNGDTARYLKGDKINPEAVTHLTEPLGSIDDPEAKIWPFKVHRAKQPYDKVYKYLIVPKTWGKGGFWTDFDWQKAVELGAEESHLPFSGQLGFAETDMHWTLTHMVAPKEHSLQCIDCHTQDGRMDWKALGYDGDPADIGGRRHRRELVGGEK